jgi:hypothetical protein
MFSTEILSYSLIRHSFHLKSKQKNNEYVNTMQLGCQPCWLCSRAPLGPNSSNTHQGMDIYLLSYVVCNILHWLNPAFIKLCNKINPGANRAPWRPEKVDHVMLALHLSWFHNIVVTADMERKYKPHFYSKIKPETTNLWSVCIVQGRSMWKTKRNRIFLPRYLNTNTVI